MSFIMKEGFGKTLYGGVVALPYFPRIVWVSLIVGLLSGSLCGWWSRKENVGSLKGATVLITGSSMGLGEQFAYQFAANGARIILTARSENKLIKVASACRKLGADEVHYFLTDMQDANQINTLIEFVKEKFNGNLDYLVLNHALMGKANLWKGTTEELLSNLHKLYDINLFAHIQLATSLLPNLEKMNGRIVVVSSISAKHNFPFFVGYSSAKAALESFFIGLRQELAIKSSNVSITIATLGRINTPGQRNAVERKYQGHEYFSPEDAESTAEIIVRGAHARTRDVYYPFWTEALLSAFVNIPFVRQLYEKILRLAMLLSV